VGGGDGAPAVREDDRAALGLRELLAEAVGVRPGQVNVSWEAILDERDQAMLAALRAVRDELGRWPTAAEWDGGGQRPPARTFVQGIGGEQTDI